MKTTTIAHYINSTGKAQLVNEQVRWMEMKTWKLRFEMFATGL